MKQQLLKLVLAVTTGLLVTSADASVLWNGDASNGTGVFGVLNIENNPGQINVVTDSTYGKVFQMICFDNAGIKTRTEGSHMAGFQPVAGGTYYFGWRHKWGPYPTLCGKWQVVEQIHTTASGGPVPFGLHVDGCTPNMDWQYENPSGTAFIFLEKPFPLNSWHTFVYHEKWSTSETDGYVEVWYDGTMQTLTNGSTRYPAAWCISGSTSYCKWGIYRSGSGGAIGTAYAYLGQAKAGTTFADVNPNPTPDFSITATPSSQTVTAGNGTSYTATVSAINGFNSSVSFSVSGLPSGASGSFNPTSVTGSGSSTLSVTTSTSTTPGTYTLTVTGTSGSLVHSANVTLVVNPIQTPDFSLSASPNSLTVVQGANGQSTITVNPVNGFSSSVSLSASGLPSGVTAAFNPSSTTTTSTLTLSASSTAATGTATVTVTGTSGSLTHNTTISLTVNSASTNNFAGIFQIQNQASLLVLNNQGSITNGSPITQWTIVTSSNLDWTFIATSNGYYQINSSKSGRDAVVQSASTAAGAKIVQWSFGSSGDDQWLPVLNSDGSYTFFNLHSGLVLADPGGSTSTSTQMDQEASNGGSNQKWTLLKQ